MPTKDISVSAKYYQVVQYVNLLIILFQVLK